MKVVRPVRFELAGGVYHVMARGNEKKAIFRDDADRHAYMERLVACRKRFGFRLYAFCLMNNHVHLALERADVALSRIVLALHSAYAGDFNRRHGRVGHLFQGRYKAFLVEKDVYLLTLVQYIHLNPVRAGLADRPEEYRWSSDHHYRAHEAPPWIDRSAVLKMIGGTPALARAGYRQLMAIDSPTYEEAAPTAFVIKGSESFAGDVMRRAQRSAAAGRPRRDWPIARIAALAAASAGLSVDQLRAPGQKKRIARERALAAYVGWKYGGIPLARAARFFGRDESTLAHGVRRIEAALSDDRSLANRLQILRSVLEKCEHRV